LRFTPDVLRGDGPPEKPQQQAQEEPQEQSLEEAARLEK
jgi:hypothetical protein